MKGSFDSQTAVLASAWWWSWPGSWVYTFTRPSDYTVKFIKRQRQQDSLGSERANRRSVRSNNCDTSGA